MGVPARPVGQPRAPPSTLKPNAAIGFLCIGGAIVLSGPAARGPRPRLVALTAAALAVGIGVATLVEVVWGVDLHIDTLIFNSAVRAESVLAPGRMSPVTALNFACLGFALLARRPAIRDSWAAVPAVLAFVAGAGYVDAFATTGHLVSYTSLSLPTALGFFAASAAIVLSRPKDGLVGLLRLDISAGALIRVLLPAVVLVPVATGWLRLYGERRGL